MVIKYTIVFNKLNKYKKANIMGHHICKSFGQSPGLTNTGFIKHYGTMTTALMFCVKILFCRMWTQPQGIM